VRRIIAWCLGNRPVVILFAVLFMGAGIFSIFRLSQYSLIARRGRVGAIAAIRDLDVEPPRDRAV